MIRTAPAIAIGRWISYLDDEHQVIGFTGPGIRLRSAGGAITLALAAEVFADPTFSVLASRPGDDVDANASPEGFADSAVGNASLDPASGLDEAALIDAVPAAERERVASLERAVREVILGPEDSNHAPPNGALERSPDVTERARAASRVLGISERQMWRHMNAYRESGVFGLVDKRKVRPQLPLAGLDERILEAVLQQAAVEEHDSTGTVTRFRRRVQSRLDTQYGLGVVAMPTDATFRRKLSAVLAGRHTFGAATTRRTAAAQPAGMHGHVRATRANQVIMVDTTRLDGLAYDGVTDTTVSVELTIAIDHFTRSIAAWRITPVGTKAVDAVLLLADMMTPQPMRPGWDDRLRWSYMGVFADRVTALDQRFADAAALPTFYPELLLIDNGTVYVSDAFKAACLRFGISLQPARFYKGTDKPEVERAFGTIRTLFSQHLAGYKGPNVAYRGRHADETARWSVEQLEDFFAEFVPIYQRRSHDGLILPGIPHTPLSPNDAYAASVAIAGYIPCPPDRNLYLELLPVKWRTLQRKGVEIDNLLYDAAILHRLRPMPSPYPGRGGKWPIRVDPRNMLQAYFKDPHTGVWHVLRWVHAEDRLAPFTDRTLEYVMSELAGRGRVHPNATEVTAALLDLQNRMDAPEASTARDRRRLARDRARARSVARDQARIEVESPLADIGLGELEGADAEPADELLRLDAITAFGLYDFQSNGDDDDDATD